MSQRPILLVEDNPDDRDLALRALAKCRPGFPVVPLSSGAEVISYLQGSCLAGGSSPCPSFVLLDLKMPQVDGLEVLRRVRGEQGLPRIPIIVMTCSTERRDIAAAYALGANSYLTKPVEYGRFVDLLDSVCRYWLDLNLPTP
ncbi:MAG TPA: two-component system response regulator [Verrucomicrobiales bacterium]|nr:two-component system response regulator [Verrucomicrobiales bacterium]